MPTEGSYDLHDFDPPEHECTCELYDRHQHLRAARHERDEARHLANNLLEERGLLEARIRAQDDRHQTLVKAAIRLITVMDASVVLLAEPEKDALRSLLS